MTLAEFFNPKFFNTLIMCLYLINAVWWAYHKSYADMWYWLSALSITACVTWGYARGD